jgi:hypothetical protein
VYQTVDSNHADGVHSAAPYHPIGLSGMEWWRPLVTIQARGRYEQPLCTSALPPHRGHDSNVRRTHVRISASKAGRLGRSRTPA